MVEINSSESARANIESFTKRFLNLEKQKKIINEDIKALKEEFKEEGVPVGIVCQVINQIKRDKKKSDTEIFELEVIKEWLETNTEIDDEIGDLIAKV